MTDRVFRRLSAGRYEYDDGERCYHVVHGWGGGRGWTVLEVWPNGTTRLLESCATLREGRAAVSRIVERRLVSLDAQSSYGSVRDAGRIGVE